MIVANHKPFRRDVPGQERPEGCTMQNDIPGLRLRYPQQLDLVQPDVLSCLAYPAWGSSAVWQRIWSLHRASALALMVAPEEACLNLERLAAEGFG